MHFAGQLRRSGRLADELAVALRDALIRQLGIRPPGLQVLCVLPDLFPDWLQQSLQHALLVHVGVASVAFTVSSCSAGISTGRWTALHVDIGYYDLRVLAVAHGQALSCSSSSSPCGGLAVRAAAAYHVIAAILRAACTASVPPAAASVVQHPPTVSTAGQALEAGQRLAIAAACGVAPIATAAWQPWADVPYRPDALSRHELDLLARSVAPAPRPLAATLRAYLAAASNFAVSDGDVFDALPLPWDLKEFSTLPKRVALRELFESVCSDELEAHAYPRLPRDVMTLCEGCCAQMARLGGDAGATFPLSFDVDRALRPGAYLPPRCDAPVPLNVKVHMAEAVAGLIAWMDDPTDEWRRSDDEATLAAARRGGLPTDASTVDLLCVLADVCDAIVESCRPELRLRAVFESVLAACPVDDRRALLSNIVITGGAAAVPGLVSRLLAVVPLVAGQQAACGNVFPPLTATFAGASALSSSLSSLQRLQHAGDSTAKTDASRTSTSTLVSMLSLMSHSGQQEPPAVKAVDRVASQAVVAPTPAPAAVAAVAAAVAASAAAVKTAPASGVAAAGAPAPTAAAASTADRLASLQRRLNKVTKK